MAFVTNHNHCVTKFCGLWKSILKSQNINFASMPLIWFYLYNMILHTYTPANRKPQRLSCVLVIAYIWFIVVFGEFCSLFCIKNKNPHSIEMWFVVFFCIHTKLYKIFHFSHLIYMWFLMTRVSLFFIIDRLHCIKWFNVIHV